VAGDSITAIGTMSGTSSDGVDVALIETDGVSVTRLGPVGYRAYESEERLLLQRAFAAATSLADRNARPAAIKEAESLVTAAHFQAIEAYLREHRVDRESVGVIGFHGQTVLHRPEARLTVQIGDGALLARELHIPVVYDFRAADVDAGGEGAPLVPVFHRAIALTLDEPPPIVVVNIGGVANVTYLDGDADPIAFDTGPGNAPIDEIVSTRTGRRFDRDGILASQGRVDESSVTRLLQDPFFARKPPKSLDRAQFARLPLGDLPLEDAVATATAFVAASIARAIQHLPRRPQSWIVAGGGARNRALMKMLRECVKASVQVAEAVGWSSDGLEAQAFAYLAVRSLKGLPLTFPTTTGVSQPMTGGVLADAKRMPSALQGQ
jgi:anhydro-N-acetylmuramic acid kinase